MTYQTIQSTELDLEFNNCDDDYIPFITLRNPIKYTILYYTVRTKFDYLINQPKALVKHYTRIYNQAFNQPQGV